MIAKWKSKLTKRQQAHLRAWGPNTLAGLARQKELSKQRRAMFGPTASCHDCDEIISRLESVGVRLPE